MASPIITIDGPSGSGKGTISRLVADRLGWRLLDSGALYRLVAYAGQRGGLSGHDEPGHADIAQKLDVQFGLGPHGGEQIWLAGEEVSQRIRTEQAGEGASRVAAMPAVRTEVRGVDKRPLSRCRSRSRWKAKVGNGIGPPRLSH